MQPSITIIIPVYNGMPFLPETIDSVLHQTYSNFRLLAVDDESKDESLQYLKSLTDSRVEVREQSNLGFGNTLNRAIESVDSEFIVHLDQDDIALPTRVEEQINFLLAHPEYDFVLSKVCKISASGKEFGSYDINHLEPFSDYTAIKYGSVSPSTFCFRRKAFLELGGYRPSVYPVDDYDLLLRAEEKFKMAVINKPLVKYRIHNNSATFKKFYDMEIKTRYIEEMARLRREGKPEIPLAEFTKDFDDLGFFKKLRQYSHTTGKLRFRKSGLLLGEKKYLSGILNLVFAYLLAPRFVVNRLFSLRKLSA